MPLLSTRIVNQSIIDSVTTALWTCVLALMTALVFWLLVTFGTWILDLVFPV